MQKEKIAIIVQRYGEQINGGAEAHAKMIAEKLNHKYNVTVLTSCAIDYHTWKPELAKGTSYENNVEIIRFTHPEKNKEKIHKLNRKYRGRLLYQKLYRFLGKPKWYLALVPSAEVKDYDGLKWLEFQGPAMYDLLPYLKQNINDYTAYIFFTYLYYPTAIGMPTVGYKSIFIPTLHDEPPAYFPVFKKVVASPACILFNTLSEKLFAEKMFDIENTYKRVVAVGIEEENDEIDKAVVEKCSIKGKYILYVGRIDTAKGCDELLQYFKEYLKSNGDNFNLVLVGKNMIEPVRHPKIIYAGFVSDYEKKQLMKQATALVVPSKYESLSLVLLESFACKVPVLANKNCEVLKDHINLSNGGWLYNTKEDFIKNLQYIYTNNTDKKAINGLKYVKENYTWNKVMDAYDNAIDFVKEKNKY